MKLQYRQALPAEQFNQLLAAMVDRQGAKISVATETSGATPIDKACQVNWIWLTGIIDLVAPKR